MNTKVVKHLGRNGFQARWATTATPGYGPPGTGTVNRVLASPGQVLYAPYSVPGYKQKIANSQDATSTLIGTKSHAAESTQYRHRTIFRYPGSNYVDYIGSGEAFATFSAVPTSAPASQPLAFALASEKFLSSYYEKSHSMRGLSSMAEFGSTVRGLASPAKALRKEVSNLYQSARGNLYRAGGPASKDAAKVLGGTWTEWQFGVKPLVNDVNDAARAFNKLINGDFRSTIPIRGTGVIENVINQSTNQGIGLGGCNFGMIDEYTIDKTIVTLRGAVIVGREGSEIPPAMQFGLGFEDILPAVWEGMPWSFMWDYFFNISSVIDAWSSGLYGRLAWSNRTVRNSRTTVLSDVRPFPPSTSGAFSQRYSCSGGHAKASYTSVTRAQVSPLDIAPPFRMKLPQFGTKWANLTALAAMKANPFQGGVFSPPEWKPVRGTRRGTRWYRQ